MSTRARILGTFLAVWSLSFACVHMAWAVGWRGGVPDSFAPISERPWFLAYDIGSGLLMYAAAAGALLLAAGRGGQLLLRVTVLASVLALLRGAPALALDVATGAYDVVGFGADIWFTVAGGCGLLLAAAAAARGQRTSDRGPRGRIEVSP
jgi:hypothetical protein